MTNYTKIIERLETTADTLTKDKVISVRIEPALFSLLELLTEAWNTLSISNTVRTLLSMFFLPMVYEQEYKHLKIEKLLDYKKEEKEAGLSPELSRFHRVIFELNEYLQFLNEAEQRGKKSMEFIQGKKQEVEGIIEELAEKEKQAQEKLEKIKM